MVIIIYKAHSNNYRIPHEFVSKGEDVTNIYPKEYIFLYFPSKSFLTNSQKVAQIDQDFSKKLM